MTDRIITLLSALFSRLADFHLSRMITETPFSCSLPYIVLPSVIYVGIVILFLGIGTKNFFND